MSHFFGCFPSLLNIFCVIFATLMSTLACSNEQRVALSENDWFIRLTPIEDSYNGQPKLFSTFALSAEDTEPLKDGKAVKPTGLIHGGIVLGRKASMAKNNAFLGYFTSPILSRAHAHLTITTNGHVYITDLNSLHGTTILAESAVAPTKLNAFVPVQLLEGDIIVLGKGVHADKKEYSPIKLKVSFHWPELGQGSDSSHRKCLERVTPEEVIGKFATRSKWIRIRCAIMKTDTYQRQIHEEDVLQGSQSDGNTHKYGIPEWMRYSSEEPLTQSKKTNANLVGVFDEGENASIINSDDGMEDSQFEATPYARSFIARSVFDDSEDEDSPCNYSIEYQSYSDKEHPEVARIKKSDHLIAKPVSTEAVLDGDIHFEYDLNANPDLPRRHRHDSVEIQWSPTSSLASTSAHHDLQAKMNRSDYESWSLSPKSWFGPDQEEGMAFVPNEDEDFHADVASTGAIRDSSFSPYCHLSPVARETAFLHDTLFPTEDPQSQHEMSPPTDADVVPSDQVEGYELLSSSVLDILRPLTCSIPRGDGLLSKECEQYLPENRMFEQEPVVERHLRGFSESGNEVDVRSEASFKPMLTSDADPTGGYMVVDDDNSEYNESSEYSNSVKDMEECEDEGSGDNRCDSDDMKSEKDEDADQKDNKHGSEGDEEACVQAQEVPNVGSCIFQYLPKEVSLKETATILKPLDNGVTAVAVKDTSLEIEEKLSIADTTFQISTFTETSPPVSSSEDEIVTPQAIGRKRSLPLEFTTNAPETAHDDSTSSLAAPVNFNNITTDEEPAPKRLKGLASSMGLVALGAALGSIGTIAGLMQLAD
ncbi:uncharacterized protein L203_102753 [Cryptococcus depauperatus CBS 7841]|uniref:FHA domain-containing protein n=1 Tax=Cryptococcus depauperatus CBS 7841 TaxID=1295531 RepID=A0AAJ8M0M4_9TREE